MHVQRWSRGGHQRHQGGRWGHGQPVHQGSHHCHFGEVQYMYMHTHSCGVMVWGEERGREGDRHCVCECQGSICHFYCLWLATEGDNCTKFRPVARLRANTGSPKCDISCCVIWQPCLVCSWAETCGLKMGELYRVSWGELFLQVGQLRLELLATTERSSIFTSIVSLASFFSKSLSLIADLRNCSVSTHCRTILTTEYNIGGELDHITHWGDTCWANHK